MLAVIAAIGASMMVSYTRARAEGLGIQLSGGMMQRAERILLVTGGALLAAWFAADPDSAAWAAPILGGTMLLCALTSTRDRAQSRWIARVSRARAARGGARAIERRRAGALPVAARSPAAAMSTPDLRKVRPLEQH